MNLEYIGRSKSNFGRGRSINGEGKGEGEELGRTCVESFEYIIGVVNTYAQNHEDANKLAGPEPKGWNGTPAGVKFNHHLSG
jgi:hypothetical protein